MARRSKPPQLNLKERIAVLQQRNAASSTSSPTTNLSTSQPRNLKDKISQFEQKGGVPIPRGSFGLGAPPVADNLKSRELYGNRIPPPVRVPSSTGVGPSSARVGSPMPQQPPLTSRKLAELDDFTEYGSPSLEIGSQFSNYRALSPQNTGGSALLTPQTTGSGFLDPLPRGTAFATALEKARKLETGSTDARAESRHTREGSISPKSLSQSRYVFAQTTGESISGENMSDLALAGVQVSERRRSYLMPIADIKDTIPLSADHDFEPPVIQVTTDLTPIVSETDEDAPPLSAFETEPSYHDHVDILPTVTCSDCNAQVALTELGDHHCVSPLPPLPASPLPPPSPLPETLHNMYQPAPLQVGESSEARNSSLRASNTAVISIEELRALREAISAPPSPLLEFVHETTKDAPEEPSEPVEILPLQLDIVDSSSKDLSTEPVVEPSVFDSPRHIVEEPAIGTTELIKPPSPLAEPPDSPQVDVSELVISEASSFPVVHLEPVPIQKLAEPPRDELPVVVDSPAVEELPSLVEPLATPPRRTQRELVESSSLLDSAHVDLPLGNVVHGESLSMAKASVAPPVTPQQSPFERSRLPPRPVSMIVESPTRPSAPTHSPFLVPSAYAPEHPKLPITSPEEKEFGTITFHRSTLSLPRSDNFASHFTEPALTQKASTFSAVVHRRVTELPADLGQIPMSPQLARTRKLVRDSADLASLLANAALLEQKLMEGELPGEASHEVQAPSNSGDALEDAVVIDHSERWKPVEHIKPSQKPRRKPSFRNLLGRSKSTKDSAPMPQVDDGFFDRRTRTRSSTSQTSSHHSRVVSAYHPPPPPPSETHQRAHSQGSQLTVKTAETSSTPPTPPPKSPPARYLSGLRRFTGAYPRNSVSTSSEISSEDSMLVVTPPNYSPDLFASSTRQGPETARETTPPRTGITWPSLSAKKSFGNLSKAKSFLSRKRSKSNSSVASAADMAERLAIESMNIPMPLPYDMPHAPPLPQIIPLASVPAERPNPPIRSKSLHSPRSSREEPPSYPPHVNRSAIMLAPPPDIATTSKARPSSWQSASTSSSFTNPSPLLDMFDAFPDVPDSPPMPSPPGFNRPVSSFASLGTAEPRPTAVMAPSPSTATVHDFPESRYTYYVQAQ